MKKTTGSVRCTSGVTRRSLSVGECYPAEALAKAGVVKVASNV